MGCDIHFVIEKKSPEQGRWIGVYSTDYCGGSNRLRAKQRNYRFFAELASVRGESSKGREPLGLPEDKSELTDICANGPVWQADGHSFSYLPATEFLSAYKDGQILEIEMYRAMKQPWQPYFKTVADDIEAVLKEDDECFEQFSYAMIGIEPFDDPDIGVKLEDFRVVFWFDN